MAIKPIGGEAAKVQRQMWGKSIVVIAIALSGLVFTAGASAGPSRPGDLRAAPEIRIVEPVTSSVCLAGRCGDGKCSCGESVHTCATDCKRVICIANKCFRSQAQAARKWASLLKQMDLPRGRGTACLLARLNAWTSLGVGV